MSDIVNVSAPPESIGSMIIVCVLLFFWALLVGVLLVYQKRSFDCRTNQAIQCWNDWKCWTPSSDPEAIVKTPTTSGSAIPGGTGYVYSAKTVPGQPAAQPTQMYDSNGLLIFSGLGAVQPGPGCVNFPPLVDGQTKMGQTVTAATCNPVVVTS